MKRLVFCVVLLLPVLALAQESNRALRDQYGQLKQKMISLKKAGQYTGALPISKKMKTWLAYHRDVFSRKIYEEELFQNRFDLGYIYLKLAEKRGTSSEYLQKAQKNFQDFLKLVPDAGEAYFYLAKSYALEYQRQGKNAKAKKSLYQRMKQSLKLATERGYSALRGMGRDPAFFFLKQDGQLFADLLGSSKRIPFNEVDSLPNPFRPKIELYFPSKNTEELPESPRYGYPSFADSIASQKKLFLKILKTFLALRKIVLKNSDNPSSKVIQLWRDLKNLLKKKDDIFIPKYQKKLQEVLKNLGEMWKRLEYVLLACYFNQGGKILRSMRKAFVKRKYEKVIKDWKNLRKLALKMANSGGENFRRTAESLLNSGQNFEKQARNYLKIKKIPLEITGIVVSVYPKKSRKVLVNGQWCGKGDVVLDTVGRPLPVKVYQILADRVYFRYRKIVVAKYLDR